MRRLAQARQRHGQRRSRQMRNLELYVGGQSTGRLKVLVTPDRKRKIQLLATLDESPGEVLDERLDALLRQFMEEGATRDAQIRLEFCNEVIHKDIFPMSNLARIL
jgi:hypothetical protein